MSNAACFDDRQQMGRRWPIGCVALEITQRCNLDCSLCYLSENSASVKDIPLEEIFRRIDLIRAHYGPNTDVQITGGEPTLRRRDELVAIVRRVRESGLRPTLMTNGRRATRALLEELANAGLMDVAFHVDTTQGDKRYRTEEALNDVRAEYLRRVLGLPLSVMFNTTVFEGNLEEVPGLVRFFVANARSIRTVSFQPQAATGRGSHNKELGISLVMVTSRIEKGVGIGINFDATRVGHPQCNRYGLCMVVNGQSCDLLDDGALVSRFQRATAHIPFDRAYPRATAIRLLGWLSGRPAYWGDVLTWTAKKTWAMRRQLLSARGRAHTLSFFVHGFMDASALERERIDACVFKVMTGDGPLSMCLHNARRDAFILQPVRVHRPEGVRFWQPFSGNFRRAPG